MSRTRRILDIPVPGGSDRIPTGAIRFQDDWPGLFIRGDQAVILGAKIRNLDKELEGHTSVIAESCLSELRKIADLIEEHVQE